MQSYVRTSKVFTVLSKPIQPSEIQAESTLHNRNSNFPLNHVHGGANGLNSVLYVAQNQLHFQS